MADFKEIKTQEEFNIALSGRLKRDREKYAERLVAELKEKGWKSPEEVEALASGYDEQIRVLQADAEAFRVQMAEKDAEIAGAEAYKVDLEKTKIALSVGLGVEQARRLRGNNAKEWKEDAEALADAFRSYSLGKNCPSPLGEAGVISSGGSPSSQFESWAGEHGIG